MDKFVEKASQLMDIGARIAVAAIMAVTTINVIMRIFGSSLKGTVELVQYLTAIGIGLGLAFCAFHGGHVAVTFLTDKLPLKGQHILNVIIDILVVGFLGTASWQLFIYGNGMKQQGEIALTLGFPIHPVVYLVTAGVAVHMLVVINNLFKTLKQLFAPSSVSEVNPEENINVEDLISQ